MADAFDALARATAAHNRIRRLGWSLLFAALFACYGALAIAWGAA